MLIYVRCPGFIVSKRSVLDPCSFIKHTVNIVFILTMKTTFDLYLDSYQASKQL